MRESVRERDRDRQRERVRERQREKGSAPAMSPPVPRETMKQSSITCTMIRSFWKVFRRMDT